MAGFEEESFSQKRWVLPPRPLFSMSRFSFPLPVRTAIAGIGGFGAAHHDVHKALETSGQSRVVATCDPALSRLGEICGRHHFAERGISLYEDFETMLAAHAGEIDLGVVATPIQCHAPMHEAFIRNGSACYLEKPPTLDPDELERMLVVEEKAVVSTNVGFSFVFSPERLDLKRRMMAGEFGALKRLSFLGLTRRLPSYYTRSNWAGKLLLDDNLLLDSCLGNAMSHYLNALLLFGNLEELQGWGRPRSMDCELYRANPIQGADTIFARGQLDNGVELRVAASHACSHEGMWEEVLEFEEAVITIRAGFEVQITRPDRTVENYSHPPAHLSACVETYFQYLRGETSRPSQRLGDCLGFVETNALFYLAAGKIHQLPTESLTQASAVDAMVLSDVEAAGRSLLEEGSLPSESGYIWAAPGGSETIASLPKLRDVIEDMMTTLV